MKIILFEYKKHNNSDLYAANQIKTTVLCLFSPSELSFVEPMAFNDQIENYIKYVPWDYGIYWTQWIISFWKFVKIIKHFLYPHESFPV